MKLRSLFIVLIVLFMAILAPLVISIVASWLLCIYVHFFDIRITGKPEFATLLVALLSVMGGLWVYYRQANAQIYMEYNKRYEQVMHDFPEKVRLNFAKAKPGDVCPECILRYLNLCSEEFYMRQEFYISHKVWTIWEGDIKRVLQTCLIRSAWKDLSKEFKSFKAFQKFVDEVQKGGSRRIRTWRWFKWRAKRFL